MQIHIILVYRTVNKEEKQGEKANKTSNIFSTQHAPLQNAFQKSLPTFTSLSSQNHHLHVVYFKINLKAYVEYERR